jgi:hypothetical protein
VVRTPGTLLPECAAIPDNTYSTKVNDTIILVAEEGSWLAYSDGALTSHLCQPRMCIDDTCSLYANPFHAPTIQFTLIPVPV